MNEDHHAATGSDVVSLLVENHRRFQAFLRPRVRSVEDAEEILQAAFMMAAEKGHTKVVQLLLSEVTEDEQQAALKIA
ncbi:MAG: hypothetical protein ABL888_18750, partial [Pirellulaceae bacterium]